MGLHSSAGSSGAEILLATPRIQKAGEQGFFKLIESAAPDGVLIRTLGAIEYFTDRPLKKTGDFSLNVANPLTAASSCCKRAWSVSVTISLRPRHRPGACASCAMRHPRGLKPHHPPAHADVSHGATLRFRSLHVERHHVPRLRAGLAKNTAVHLRDRVGVEHLLRPPMSAAVTRCSTPPRKPARSFFRDFQATGLRNYRIELLEEILRMRSRAIIRALTSPAACR